MVYRHYTFLFQNGLQALHFAAKTHNVELAVELIKKGADVNVATQVGNYRCAPHYQTQPVFCSH